MLGVSPPNFLGLRRSAKITSAGGDLLELKRGGLGGLNASPWGVNTTTCQIEDEDDEWASGSGSGDRQSGVDLDRQDEDRQGGDSEGNSRATSRQRLGGGGKAGVLT